MSEFHYEWSLLTNPKRVRNVVADLDNQLIRIQWKSGGGAIIERDVSGFELDRWKIRAFQIQELEEIEGFLRKVLAPLASHEIKLHPVYRDTGFSFVGWIFFHRKEEG